MPLPTSTGLIRFIDIFSRFLNFYFSYGIRTCIFPDYSDRRAGRSGERNTAMTAAREARMPAIKTGINTRATMNTGRESPLEYIAGVMAINAHTIPEPSPHNNRRMFSLKTIPARSRLLKPAARRRANSDRLSRTLRSSKPQSPKNQAKRPQGLKGGKVSVFNPVKTRQSIQG